MSLVTWDIQEQYSKASSRPSESSIKPTYDILIYYTTQEGQNTPNDAMLLTQSIIATNIQSSQQSSCTFWSIRRSIRAPNTPMRLVSNTSILPNAHWLPRLIKSLEREDVHAPVKDATNSIRPEDSRGINTRHRSLVIRPSSWPSSLPNPKFRPTRSRPRNIFRKTF